MRRATAPGRATAEGEAARASDFLLGSKEVGRTATKPPRQAKPFTVARALLKPPPRLAKPKPKAAAPSPDPFEGLERLGPCIVLARDATRKRAAAKCTHCSTIREIGLNDGVPNCGCANSLRPGAESFAEAVVAAEKYVAASRHRGRR